jgi:hypothetical protein
MHAVTKGTLQQGGQLLVCSPVSWGELSAWTSILLRGRVTTRCVLYVPLLTPQLRRTMETMIVGFPHLQSRLEVSGRPPILLDILQEVGK